MEKNLSKAHSFAAIEEAREIRTVSEEAGDFIAYSFQMEWRIIVQNS